MNDANKNINNSQRKQPVFQPFFEKTEIKSQLTFLKHTEAVHQHAWKSGGSQPTKCYYNRSLLLTDVNKLIATILASQSRQMCHISAMFHNCLIQNSEMKTIETPK